MKRINKMTFSKYGWYPYDSEECKKQIKSYLSEYENKYDDELSEKVAGIVPHAGWFYSGKLACYIIKLLAENNSTDKNPDTIVLFGGHTGPSDLPVLLDSDAYETPFGAVEMDKVFQEEIKNKFKCQRQGSVADNTIELQLPFIKYFFPNAELLAIRPPASDEATLLGEYIYDVAERLDKKIICIGSTDLTHYGMNYGFSPKGIGKEALDWVKNVNDKKIIEYAQNMDSENLIQHATENHAACSIGAVASCIGFSKKADYTEASTVDYYTSYDIMPNDSFVGYLGLLYGKK